MKEIEKSVVRKLKKKKKIVIVDFKQHFATNFNLIMARSKKLLSRGVFHKKL